MSVAYKLLETGMPILGAWGWLQAFKSGQVKIPDFNEAGDSGTLLHVAMAAGRPFWNGSGLGGDGRTDGFGADPAHEGLLIWLMEQGADPWVFHEGRNAWSEALYRGWPQMMEYLAARPDAPSRAALEGQRVDTGGQNPLPAPVAFALRNDLDALRAWGRAGLSVNLGVAEGRSAGTSARTAEFLKGWVDLGGNVAAPLPDGRSLPLAWSGLTAATRVAMERVWAASSAPEDRPIGDRFKQLLDGFQVPKTLFAHKMRQLQVDPDTPGGDGRPFCQHWLDHHLARPQATSSHVAMILLEPLTVQDRRRAVVAGLRAAAHAPGKTIASLPRPEHLRKLLSLGRLGPVDQALRALADATLDQPAALAMVVEASIDLARSDPAGPLCEPGEPADRDFKGSDSRMRQVAGFWRRWFMEPREGGVLGRGWLALACWAANHVPEAGFPPALAHPFFQAMVEGLDPDARQAAAIVLGCVELRLQIKLGYGKMPADILSQWQEGRLGGWASGVSPCDPSARNAGQAGEILEKALRSDVGRNQDVLDSLFSAMRAARLERSLSSATPRSGPRPRI